MTPDANATSEFLTVISNKAYKVNLEVYLLPIIIG